MEWIWENEKKVLLENAPMILPILVQEEDGKTRIEAYTGIRAIAEAYEAHFAGRFFTKAAIDWLDSQLEPYVNRLGYYRESRGLYRWYEVYELNSEHPANSSKILPVTVQWNGNDCACELLLDLDAAYPAFIVKQDGKIVSAARTNEFDPCSSLPELTVETAPAWRGKGYASSNIAALGQFLLNKYPSVSYVCSRYNRASQKTAQNAGFVKIGRFYAYSAYKD